MSRVTLEGVKLALGIDRHRVHPGIWRVSCKACGVTGREHGAKIGTNGDATAIRAAMKEHAAEHLEQALDEHRARLRPDPDATPAGMSDEERAARVRIVRAAANMPGGATMPNVAGGNGYEKAPAADRLTFESLAYYLEAVQEQARDLHADLQETTERLAKHIRARETLRWFLSDEEE